MTHDETPTTHHVSDHRHLLVVVGVSIAVYVVLLYLGLGPIGRNTLFISMMSGALVGAIGRPMRHTFEMARDWLPLVIALSAYDFVRSVVDGHGNPVAVEAVIKMERVIGFGSLPARDLFNAVGGLDRPAWLALLSDVVWVSHFWVPLLFAVYLWIRRRDLYLMYATTSCVLFVLAVIVYWIQPTAPPWFAASDAGQHGPALDHLVRTSGQGLSRLGIDFVTQIVSKGTSSSNPFAAFPSLHAGAAMLVALFTTSRLSQNKWRWLVWLYPLAMVFVIVSTGEHYLVDTVAIVPFIALSWMIGGRVAPRLARVGTRSTSSPES